MTEQILIVFGILGRRRRPVRVRTDAPRCGRDPRGSALNLTGVLTIQEALAGFGQPVVVLIAAVLWLAKA